MAIFNNSNSDVDISIITFFENKEKIVFSGVNKASYQTLTNNNYFKKLFELHHPELSTSNTFNNKKNVIQYLCDRHPTNCWKVASCVFQTGRLNFSSLFLNAAIPCEIKELIEQQAALKTQLVEVSAKFDQAKLEHEQTQHLLASNNSNREAKRTVMSMNRQAEFANFHQNIVPNLQTKLAPRMPTKDDALQSYLEFDGRLLPVINLATYQGLNRAKESLETSLEGVKDSLIKLQKPDFVFNNEKNKICALLNCNLVEFILEFVKKPENLNERDIAIVKSTSRLYAITINHEGRINSTMFNLACYTLRAKITNFCVDTEAENQGEKNPVLKTNAKKIDDVIEEERYANALNECLTSIAEANFSIETFTEQVECLFSSRRKAFEDKNSIRDDLRREIQARYGDEALMNLDQSALKVTHPNYCRGECGQG